MAPPAGGPRRSRAPGPADLGGPKYPHSECSSAMVPPGESPNRAGRRRRNRSEAAPAPGRGQRAQGRAGTQPAQRWRLRLRAARRLG